jgi:hypothetical protein
MTAHLSGPAALSYPEPPAQQKTTLLQCSEGRLRCAPVTQRPRTAGPCFGGSKRKETRLWLGRQLDRAVGCL